MALPLKSILDLDLLTDAQLVALYRIVGDSGRVELAGIAFADVKQRLDHRLRHNKGFSYRVEDLDAAYVEVNQYVIDRVGTVGASPLV